jgi:hypothetical protein
VRESFDQANDQSGTSFPHDDDDDEDDDDDDSVLTSANLRMDEDDDSHYEECSNPYSNSEHAYSSGIVCSVSVQTGSVRLVYSCYSSVTYIIQFRNNFCLLALALHLCTVKILLRFLREYQMHFAETKPCTLEE